MYIIECVSKLGARRFVRDSGVGVKTIAYSSNLKDAQEFEELSIAQSRRDQALEDNEMCMIIRR